MKSFIDYITEEQTLMKEKGYEQMTHGVKDGFNQYINELCFQFQDVLRKSAGSKEPALFGLEITGLLKDIGDKQVFFTYQFRPDVEILRLFSIGYWVDKKLILLELSTPGDLPPFKELVTRMEQKLAVYASITQIAKRKKNQWIK